MKRIILVLICFQLISCHKKKLTEVVEVPLPSKSEKIEIGKVSLLGFRTNEFNSGFNNILYFIIFVYRN